jgi:hypothetical protein
MSDNGNTVLGSPMFGEAQFCVPKNNPHQITRNTFTSELKKKTNLELDQIVTSKTTRGYHQEALTIPEVEVPLSQGYRMTPRSRLMHPGLSSPKVGALPTAQLRGV